MTVWEVGLLVNSAILVLIAFAMSGLMRQIMELRAEMQQGPASGLSEAPAALSARALQILAERGDPPYLVLLSDPHCLSCQQLKQWLSGLPEPRRRRFLVVERETGPVPSPPPVYRLVRDNGLFQELDKGITPLLVVADKEGRIVRSGPAGGPEELEQLEEADRDSAGGRQAIRG